MAIKTGKKEEKQSVNYVIDVKRVKDFSKDGKTRIAFDMEVNGITIYGCWYSTYTKNGEEKGIVNFPSEKSSDGKYYNKVYFFITKQYMEVIEKQIQAML